MMQEKHATGDSNSAAHGLPFNNMNLAPEIINTLDEALFLFDAKFQFAWYNKACNELYKHVSGKFIDSSFDFNDLLTTEQQPVFIDHLGKVLDGEKAHFEWKYTKTITKWLSVSLYPFTSADNTFTGICGSLRDITEKKYNEQSLLRNTAILNNISDAVIYTDKEQRVAYLNKSAEEIYGFTPDEIIGRPLFDMISYEYIDDSPENVSKMIRDKGQWEGRIIYNRRDQKKVYLLAALNRLTDRHGNVIGLIATNKDITEEEENRQQSLDHQRNKYAIVNNINEGVILVDCRFTILVFNQRASILEKRNDTELGIGKNLLDLLPDARKEPVQQYLDHAMKGETVEYEVRYLDNTWLLINFLPVKNDHNAIDKVLITSRDITERKKAEEQVRANERKYRTLVNSLGEGVILQTLDNEILIVNKSAERILGLSSEELLEKGFQLPGMTFIDEKEREITAEHIFFRKNGKLSYVKNKIIGLRRNDSIQWLKLNSAGVGDSTDKKNSTVVISFEDITEQKRLSSEMEVLSLVAKETNNAVCILDTGGEILWINEGFTRLTGFNSDELIGTRSRGMLFGPDTDMEVIKRMTHCRENGIAFKEEISVYTKDRKKICTIVQGQPMGCSNGTGIPKFFTIITDITEEKKAIQEMEVLSMVAKETSNSVIIFDKITGSTLWVNEGFTRLTGFKKEDIIDKNPVQVLAGPETDKATLQYMAGQIEENLSYFGELLIYAKDGSKRLHQVIGQPIKAVNGVVTKYFAIGTDITEKRRMEEERLQKEIELQKEITRVTLETQEASRNELGRELHDNINQILGAVKLQLSHTLSNYGAGKPVIEKSVQNIKDAMEEIRKLSHRMVIPDLSNSSLQDKLRKLIENYNYVYVIRLDTENWKNDGTPVHIKETFYRIAQEQLTNIHKHAQATNIIIQLKSDRESAHISIEDNGRGFDPGKMQDGIGMANIRNRAELYDGSFRLISAPGKGCSLKVSIPHY